MRTWKRDFFLPLLALLAIAGCAQPPPPEQRVRDFIAEVETLVENREFTELVDRIAGDYLDAHGNDKLKAVAILRGFYLKNKSVHLLVRIDEIRVPTPDRAAATVYVAMARRPFTDAEAAGLPRTQMHRVDVELAADGDGFEILQTRWERANAADALF